MPKQIKIDHGRNDQFTPQVMINVKSYLFLVLTFSLFTYIGPFTRRLRLHVPFLAPFFSAAPLIFLTYFNVMCEHHHRNAFNPFLNGKKKRVNQAVRSAFAYFFDLCRLFAYHTHPPSPHMLTRMHSSRMRATHSSSHLLGGGVCLSACGGVTPPIPPGVGLDPPPGCGPGDPPRPDPSTSPP